jgi:hypothetical protein
MWLYADCPHKNAIVDLLHSWSLFHLDYGFRPVIFPFPEQNGGQIQEQKVKMAPVGSPATTPFGCKKTPFANDQFFWMPRPSTAQS